MKICPKCGSENKNEAKFCNECGNKLMPEVTAVEDVNDSVSDNVESFAENSDKDKDVEENISYLLLSFVYSSCLCIWILQIYMPSLC